MPGLINQFLPMCKPENSIAIHDTTFQKPGYSRKSLPTSCWHNQQPFLSALMLMCQIKINIQCINSLLLMRHNKLSAILPGCHYIYDSIHYHRLLMIGHALT